MKHSTLLVVFVLLAGIGDTMYAYDIVEKSYFLPKPFSRGVDANSTGVYWVTDEIIMVDEHRPNWKEPGYFFMFINAYTGEIVHQILLDINIRISIVDKELGIVFLQNKEEEVYIYLDGKTGKELDRASLDNFYQKERYKFYYEETQTRYSEVTIDPNQIIISKFKIYNFLEEVIYTVDAEKVLGTKRWRLDSDYAISDYMVSNGKMLLTAKEYGGSNFVIAKFQDQELQEIKISTDNRVLFPTRFLNDFSILAMQETLEPQPHESIIALRKARLEAQSVCQDDLPNQPPVCYLDQYIAFLPKFNPVILDSDFTVLYRNKDIIIPEGIDNFDLSPDKTQMVAIVEYQGGKNYFDIYTIHTNTTESEVEDANLTIQKRTIGRLNDSNVNVREDYSLQSKVLFQVNKESMLKIIERTKNKYPIGEMEDYWYKGYVLEKDGVTRKTQDGKELVGWIYGAFIDFEEAKSDQKKDNVTEPNEAPPNNEDANDSISIDNNTLSQNTMLILISSGIALLLLGLGIIVIVRRKNKIKKQTQRRNK